MKIYTYDYFLNAVVESNEEMITQVIQGKEEAYEYFEIPKKQGMREICGLQKNKIGNELVRLQKKIYKNFFGKIPIAISAKGFVRGESYQSYLQPHLGNRFFMRIDIADFFPSFSEEVIDKGLKEYVYDTKARMDIIELCTVAGKIPQGAITSPVLSNILFARVDQRILKYCQTIEARKQERYKKKENDVNYLNASHICYTRYADDMLFSSDFFDFEENRFFQGMVVNILEDYGFRINKSKTIMSRNQLSLNGYVVGRDLHLSRNKLKKINGILYYFRDFTADTYRLDKYKLQDKNKILREINQITYRKGLPGKTFGSIQQFTYYLGGCRSWILAVLQCETDTSKNRRNMQKIVRRIETLLDELQKLEG